VVEDRCYENGIGEVTAHSDSCDTVSRKNDGCVYVCVVISLHMGLRVAAVAQNDLVPLLTIVLVRTAHTNCTDKYNNNKIWSQDRNQGVRVGVRGEQRGLWISW
jgi:hypothetical protein